MFRTLLPTVAVVLALTGCTVDTGPDPRDGFSSRNVGKTLVTYVDGLGSQVVHLSQDGGLHIWSSAGDGLQRGHWKYDILATGAATTYQGAGGVNHPVQELETGWGLCFKFVDADGNILRRPNGGDWNCALFADYEALIVERTEGDRFNLTSGVQKSPLPAERRLTLSDLVTL